MDLLLLENQLIIMRALQQLVGIDDELLVQIKVTEERLENDRALMARASDSSIC